MNIIIKSVAYGDKQVGKEDVDMGVTRSALGVAAFSQIYKKGTLHIQT